MFKNFLSAGIIIICTLIGGIIDPHHSPFAGLAGGFAVGCFLVGLGFILEGNIPMP